MEVFLLALVASLAITSRPREETFNPWVDPNPTWDPVQLPRIEGRDFEPHSIPWDDINAGVPLPQANRSIQMNHPEIWQARHEVETEPVHVQRDPLYPDDLRAVDVTRSRQQDVLMDANNRNYQFGGYHIPYLPENKTDQEVAQSNRLAGRIYNTYTTGGQDRNGPITNMKDPSVQVVRQTAGHTQGDRSMYQVWDKRQFDEFIDDVYRDATPQDAVINEPNEWMNNTKIRDIPTYLNAAKNQHGYYQTLTFDGRADILSIDPMYKKKLILLQDQGVPTSQVTHLGAFNVNSDTSTLRYPDTGRRREILPEVGFGGTFQGGTGRTFLDNNDGHEKGKYLRARHVLGQHLFPIPHTVGERYQYPKETPWLSYDPTVDHVEMPRGTYSAYMAQGEPWFQAENAHQVEVPLLR